MTESNFLKQNAYLFSYIIIMIASMLYGYSEFNSVTLVPMPMSIKIFWGFGIVTFILIQVFLLFFNYSKGNKKIIASLLIFILYVFGIFGEKSINLMIICLFLLIINSNLVQFEAFIKLDFIIRVICFISLITCFLLNMIPSVYNIYILRGQTLRSSLGFNHPNTLGGYYLYILISLMFYILINNKEDIRIYKFNYLILYTIVIISGFFIEFIYADSRSSQVAFIIIIILMAPIIFNNNVKMPKPIWGITFFVVVYIVSITLIFKYDPNSNFFNILNKISSNRFYLQNLAFNVYGFGIFNTSGFMQGRPLWVDNQYAFNLIYTGIIGSIIYAFIYIKSIIKAYNVKSYLLYVVLISLILKGCFESTIIDYYAMMPIVASFMISNNKLEKENNLGGNNER